MCDLSTCSLGIPHVFFRYALGLWAPFGIPWAPHSGRMGPGSPMGSLVVPGSPKTLDPLLVVFQRIWGVI